MSDTFKEHLDKMHGIINLSQAAALQQHLIEEQALTSELARLNKILKDDLDAQEIDQIRTGYPPQADMAVTTDRNTAAGRLQMHKLNPPIFDPVLKLPRRWAA